MGSAGCSGFAWARIGSLLMLAIHWPMPFHASHFVRWDDKIVHFALYGGLAMLLSPVVEFLLPGWPVWKRATGVVIAVMVQGAVRRGYAAADSAHDRRAGPGGRYLRGRRGRAGLSNHGAAGAAG